MLTPHFFERTWSMRGTNQNVKKLLNFFEFIHFSKRTHERKKKIWCNIDFLLNFIFYFFFSNTITLFNLDIVKTSTPPIFLFTFQKVPEFNTFLFTKISFPALHCVLTSSECLLIFHINHREDPNLTRFYVYMYWTRSAKLLIPGRQWYFLENT
jgi:hypothetical protein